MLKIIRTDSPNPDFQILVAQLNLYLKGVDGDDHDFYMQYNGIEQLNNVVVAYIQKTPVGCGAFKQFDISSVEIKRMFTHPDHRNKNIATLILKELEVWANDLGYRYTVLETGRRQVEAVKFYKKNGYIKIENFGPYKGIDNSVCFKKNIINE